MRKSMVISNLPRSEQCSTELVRVERMPKGLRELNACIGWCQAHTIGGVQWRGVSKQGKQTSLLRSLARKSTRRKTYDKEKRSEWLWISSKSSDKTQLVPMLTTAEEGQIDGRVGTAAQTPTISERRGTRIDSARNLGQPPINVMSWMSETSFCNIQL